MEGSESQWRSVRVSGGQCASESQCGGWGPARGSDGQWGV